MSGPTKKVLTTFKDVFLPISPVKAVSKTQQAKLGLTDSHPTRSEVARSPKYEKNDPEAGYFEDHSDSSSEDIRFEVEQMKKGHVHRNLSGRQLQLIAIGGTIGVGMFTNITRTLVNVGPLNILLGCMFWVTPIFATNVCCAEMVCYLPIPSPFIRLGERVLDDALSFTCGWNYWVLQGSLIPWELTLFNSLINYWDDNYSPAIVFSVLMVVYFLINVSAVNYYGEFEFWFGIFKVLLAIGLIFFVFFTMVGANPQHDVYGFRYWKEQPLIPYIHDGSLGRFQGFLQSAIAYSFLIAGPEYISLAAGEVRRPRKVLPGAYKAVFIRIMVFFIGGAWAISTVISAKDKNLLAAIANNKSFAGSSAYVIAMQNMGIKVLPDIVNAVLLTTAFSAGLGYSFCSSRSLYGLSIDGKAPWFLSYTNKSGVPIYAVLLSLCWGFLAFLSLGTNSATVLNWIVNLVTASQLLNFSMMIITYLGFYRAVKAKGLDRRSFPFRAWFMPYTAIYGLVVIVCMLGVQGYQVFYPGNWSVQTFLFSYLMVFVDIGLFLFWKLYKRTKFVKPIDADLTSGLEEVELHEKYMAYLDAERGGPKKHSKWFRLIEWIVPTQ